MQAVQGQQLLPPAWSFPSCPADERAFDDFGKADHVSLSAAREPAAALLQNRWPCRPPCQLLQSNWHVALSFEIIEGTLSYQAGASQLTRLSYCNLCRLLCLHPSAVGHLAPLAVAQQHEPPTMRRCTTHHRDGALVSAQPMKAPTFLIPFHWHLPATRVRDFGGRVREV